MVSRVKFGMVMYTLLYFKWIINKAHLIAQETMLHVIWQPG